MNDKEQIKEIVTTVASLQDLRRWEQLEEYFVKNPFVDNKSITGEMPSLVPRRRLIDSWRREIGSYFYATRHFVHRLAIRMISSRRARVSTTVENKHYVADRGERYVWTVKGTIDYIMVKTSSGSWKISQMIFRLNDQIVQPIGVAA